MSDTPLADALKDHYCLSHLDWYNLCCELERQNIALHKDKERLDFLSTLTGSGWACLHLDQKGANDDWFLSRKQIDRRMATEPKQ